MIKGISTWLALGTLTAAAASGDGLAKGFSSPPNSARPWVYWFPLDGNISSNGITLDLEAMKRVGVGGVLYMETDQGAPRGPAKFAGPVWRDLFKHICAEANRLGLEVNMNNDAGWCGSGGPWIPAELSMQRVVWAETNLVGPQHFDAVLPQGKAVQNFYRDIAVYAFPTPASGFIIPHLSGKSAATKEEIPPSATFAEVPKEATVARDRIVDLTPKLGKDGHLAWEVPAGKWTVLRLGHTTTGKDNHPAPIDGRGLECDKLSKQASETMFNGLMAKLIADNQKFVGEKRTLVSTHIDSWEVGSQNWTPKFREEFTRLRGYDPMPLLPVLSGVVVDSLEVSERFLWDIRQTVNDLLLENYAGHFRTLAHRNGIRLSIEAYDGVPADDMSYAGVADEPMGEFWSYTAYSGSQWCTEMASSAHVYGKRVLGAEAFTATDAEKWQGHPGSIKAMGDWAFCEGINRFVFHRYALQPWTDARPGMSMGPWGLHYERTQTWWEQSKAWHEYLARCQFMLQQGLFVADLCFLAPEMTPQRFRSPVKSGIDRPAYNFDGCPPEALLTRMHVKQGRLVLPDGMSYRMLVLPQVETMTPRLLNKVKQLITDGATVVGTPPVKSPSLAGYPQCDGEVQSLARELWGTGEAPAEVTERAFGKGRLIWGGEIRPRAKAAPKEQNQLAKAKWIWTPEGNPAAAAPVGKRFFRRVFTIDGGSQIASAQVLMTADNAFECWVNGRRVGAGENFKQSYPMNVAAALKPGTNVLAVAAVNGADNPNPAGLIGVLTIKFADGRVQQVPTGPDWLAATTAEGKWESEMMATNGWTAAMELGPLGMEPWGAVESDVAGSDPIPDITILCRLLEKMGVSPDFSYDAKSAPEGLRYIHKRIGETEFYFVASKNPEAVTSVCSFRVQGKTPELWWPDTGRSERPARYDLAGKTIRLPIRFEPHGSVFVVFRGANKPERDRVLTASRNGTDAPADLRLTRGAGSIIEALAGQPGEYVLNTADGRSRKFTVAELPEPMTLAGPWLLSFDRKWGGPESITFEHLEDWAKRLDPGIRYYSGTAVYRKTFTFSGQSGEGNRWFLDLGKVAVMAEVKLNGKNLGIAWKPPFRMEITDALKSGSNELEVKVVNLWINRQIGDENLPEDSDRNPNGTLKAWPQWLNEGKPSPTGRFTFTSWRLWKKDDKLAESGLLGPVRIEPAKLISVRK